MSLSVNRDTSVGSFQAWGYDAVDFDDFHRVELPRRLADGVNDEVAWSVAGSAPIAVQLPDGRAYSYVSGHEGVSIEPGVVEDAEAVIAINEQAWQDHVYEFRTAAGLVLSEAIRFARGGDQQWEPWKPAMRCMYSGKRIYDPLNVDLDDADGQPLDLHRSFDIDDDFATMSHFLRTAGFLVVKGALRHRVGEIADEVERLRSEATEGELWSWWTTDETTGNRFPYRLVFMGERSDLIRSLGDDDPTVAKLVSLLQRPLVPLHDRGQGDLTVLKPFDQTAKVGGIAANLGWHQDCGLGGCPIMCPSINLGIQLDSGNADASQLWVLAGSQGTVGRSKYDIEERDGWPAIALETEPGDVTIHYSCALHAGPPPTGPNGRRTVYLPFYDEKTLSLLGRFQSFEQIIPGYGTGDLPSLDDVASKLY